jgi:outer membrane protein OmpA-like peptidoglycan-associated protein
MTLELAGHTDSDGDDSSNLTLSQKRADAVLNYLLSKGVDADRLTAVGYGETRPIDTNDTDAGKQNNRRTEFQILTL